MGRAVAMVAIASVAATGLIALDSAVGRDAPAAAADLSLFQPGDIISDALFFDPNAMTEGEIQSFLNSKVSS
ncbi:MAG: hypothetical protein Q8M65_01565, partial [Rhodoglobus sp.]|nr:hypothetical protein [Rhodoglobus sp.]